MYNILILTKKNEYPKWVADTINSIKESNVVNYRIGSINNLEELGNKVIPAFQLVARLGKIFSHQKINFFQQTEIEIEHNFHGVKAVKSFLANNKFDYVLWLGDSEIIKAISPHIALPLWYIDKVTTHANRVDAAFIAMLSGLNYTPYAMYEIKTHTKNLIGWAISNNHSYSIQMARSSYAPATGIPARILKKSNPSSKVPIWYNYTDLSLKRDRNAVSVIIRLLHKIIVTVLNKIRGRFNPPRWILGFGKRTNNSYSLIPKTDDIKILRHPDKKKGWADSFMVKQNDKTIIFAEEIDQHWRGHLVSISITDSAIKTQDILKKDYHLSYPYVFQFEKNWYMVPESSENKFISLYKAKDFPNIWEWHSDLVKGCFVDATIFEFDGKWWMFTNGKKYAQSFNEELHIYYASSPLDVWKPHKLNPIKNDLRLTRCAGRPIIKDQQVYIPVQDCALRYGHKIVWTKILTLSEFEYNAEVVEQIMPNWTKGINATHTVDLQDDYFVLDGLTCNKTW
jgi:hypothetical protein